LPVRINGQTYYRTADVCERTAISRATLFRWLKKGVLTHCLRDRRGWRLYTAEDLSRIRDEANKVETDYSS
jgi:DNA-binding transcriptional MerR regulator